MDLINSNEVVTTVVSGSTGYLTQFMPIFALVVGIALAFAVISGIFSAFFGKNLHDDDTGV
jgi:ABC-type uncharacterized transport system permease subunit